MAGILSLKIIACFKSSWLAGAQTKRNLAGAILDLTLMRINYEHLQLANLFGHVCTSVIFHFLGEDLSIKR